MAANASLIWLSETRPIGAPGASGGRGAAEGAAEGAAPAMDGSGSAPAPDISAMSPQERADRLFDRVMRLNEEGKRDSVAFFAPMVVSAYQMLGVLDAGGHYDLGRIGIVVGAPTLARAEADTILRANPTHLLGLILAAQAARAANDAVTVRREYERFVASEPAELQKGLPEYARHRPDIEAAAAEARRLGVNGAH